MNARFLKVIYCLWIFYRRVTTWNTLYNIPVPITYDRSWAQTAEGDGGEVPLWVIFPVSTARSLGLSPLKDSFTFFFYVNVKQYM